MLAIDHDTVKFCNDSGCSIITIHDRSLLFDPVDCNKQLAPYSSNKINVTATGTLRVEFTCHDGTMLPLDFKNVSYVPGLPNRTPLVSTSTLLRRLEESSPDDRPHEVLYHDGGFIRVADRKIELTVGNKVYYVQARIIRPPQASSANKVQDEVVQAQPGNESATTSTQQDLETVEASTASADATLRAQTHEEWEKSRSSFLQEHRALAKAKYTPEEFARRVRRLNTTTPYSATTTATDLRPALSVNAGKDNQERFDHLLPDSVPLVKVPHVDVPVMRMGQPLVPTDPTSFRQSQAGWDWREWLNAIIKTLNKHLQLTTFSLVPQDSSMTVINAKEVYKNKMKGNVHDKRKQRVTAMGNQQKRGINFSALETWAPTAGLEIRFMVLNWGLMHGFNICIIDVVAAFINTDLHKYEPDTPVPAGERIFMRVPPSWRHILNVPAGFVMELHKCVEGLRQSGHRFYKDVSAWLFQLGYVRSTVDLCVFFNIDADGTLTLVVVIHVDDVIYTGTDNEMHGFVIAFRQKFDTTDPEDIDGATVLGTQVTYDKARGILTLSLAPYIDKCLGTFGLDNIKPARTPFTGLILDPVNSAPRDEEERNAMKRFAETVRQQVGALQYIGHNNRMEIKPAVNEVARYMKDPGPAVRVAVHRVWSYLKGTKEFALVFDREKNSKPELYADSDFSMDPASRRSMDGGVCIQHGGVLYALCKLQTAVSKSTTEAELKALTHMTRIGLHIREFAIELRLMSPFDPITIYEDNAPAKTIAITGKRNNYKAMERDAFYVCEQTAMGTVAPTTISTDDNIADLMTKTGFVFEKFDKFRTNMGIIPMPEPQRAPVPTALMVDTSRAQLQNDMMGLHKSWSHAPLSYMHWVGVHFPHMFPYPELLAYSKTVRKLNCTDDKHGAARHKNSKKTCSKRVHAPGTALTADASGPFPPSIGGNKYRLTFSDLGSKVRKSFFAPEITTEFALACLRQVVMWFWNQMGTNIVYLKILRTDYASAFTSRDFREYIANHGIKHEGPAPNEHSGLGVAEKAVQDADCAQIKNMHSSGFADSRPGLWAEVAASNELITNVMPRPALKGLSPMQQLDPTFTFDLSRITGKPIGCLVFATKPLKGNGPGSQQKGKSKIHACCLVGHQTPLESKDCFRLVKLKNGRVITARSVYFYPDVFPYQCNSPWKSVQVPSAEAFQNYGEDSDSDDADDGEGQHDQELKTDDPDSDSSEELLPQRRYPARSRSATQRAPQYNRADYDEQAKHDRRKSAAATRK